MEGDLEIFKNELTDIENKHIEYFKSKPPMTKENEHLKLKDCISYFQFYGVPKIGQSSPAPGNANIYHSI